MKTNQMSSTAAVLVHASSQLAPAAGKLGLGGSAQRQTPFLQAEGTGLTPAPQQHEPLPTASVTKGDKEQPTAVVCQ